MCNRSKLVKITKPRCRKKCVFCIKKVRNMSKHVKISVPLFSTPSDPAWPCTTPPGPLLGLHLYTWNVLGPLHDEWKKCVFWVKKVCNMSKLVKTSFKDLLEYSRSKSEQQDITCPIPKSKCRKKMRILCQKSAQHVKTCQNFQTDPFCYILPRACHEPSRPRSRPPSLHVKRVGTFAWFPDVWVATLQNLQVPYILVPG